MKKRGVLYLHWGSKRGPLDRSLASLKSVHPELPVHVQQLPDASTLLDKAAMARLSPFEETLFLDSDTVVLDRLDFGFDMARRHGLACCVCECPWARRYGGLASHGDMVEYNTGMILFVRRPDVQAVFEEWERRARMIDSSIVFLHDGKPHRMPLNDQASFADAIACTGFNPYVLPLNWNFRPAWHRSWWGPIKVWHDYSDPPEAVLRAQAEQLAPGAIVQYRQFGA